MRGAWLTLLLGTAVACVRVPAQLPVGESPPPSAALPNAPVTFDFESVDDRAVNAPAFRGKPAVIAFVVTDTLAGQAEADILAGLAQREPDAARFAIVAVEPEERRELVTGFIRFFTDKTHAPLLGALADKDLLIGQGPFGDVRGLTVVVLDARGRIVLRKTGIVPAADITRALAKPTM